MTTQESKKRRVARFLKKTKEALSCHPIIGTKCLMWTGAVMNKMGHGGASYKGKTTTAHRVAWMLFRGEIPEGLCVLHRCDVPSCVNLQHLWLGTRRENMEDAAVKGRMRSKLSASDVVEIRRRKTGRKGTTALAREFGVSVQSICEIVRGRLRKHVEVTP